MMRISTAWLVLAAAWFGQGCASTPASTTHAGEKFAKFGTNKIHYVVEGRGPKTLVFIHGWAGNTGVWREQISPLTDKARLILIDLPGHGQSDKPEVNYTIDYFASAVLAVLNDAHVDRATLIGHSMGTPVICRVYAKQPDKVAALVAVDGILRRPPMKPEQIEGFIAPFKSPDYREHTRRFVGAMFKGEETAALRDKVCEEMLLTPQYVMSSAMENMFSPTQVDWNPGRVKIPVLAINAESPMWSPAYEEFVRSLSASTDYKTMNGVGHFLMLEKSAEFNATLLEMLRKFDLIEK